MNRPPQPFHANQQNRQPFSNYPPPGQMIAGGPPSQGQNRYAPPNMQHPTQVRKEPPGQGVRPPFSGPTTNGIPTHNGNTSPPNSLMSTQQQVTDINSNI